jgi:hypothetical protein
MSLVKSPEMTPAKTAANQANAHLSHGPATLEGMERLRDANTVHGFYSQAEGEALRALGEDPEDFKTLLKEVMAAWQPAPGFEARLVKRLARALWRCERDDRWQESVAVRQVQGLDENVARLTREAEARFKKTQAALKWLVEATKKEDFTTGFDEILAFGEVFGEDPKGRIWDMLMILYRLVQPGTPERGKAPAGYEGLQAMPDLPIAEGHHRPAVRRELRERLEAEMEARKVAHEQELKDLADTANPYYRTTLLAPTHPQAQLMLRSEDSNFRRVERLTNMLLRIRAKTPPPTPATHTQYEGESHDVDENKGP